MDETTNQNVNSVAIAPQEQQTTAVSAEGINWVNPDSLGRIWKVASAMSNSQMLPDNYKGRPENVIIAMDISNRIGMSLMTVCQNLYIVQGKPAWSGQFCISAINACGKFSPLEFMWLGENGEGGCMARATNLLTNKVCDGTPITPEMVRGFGWDKKNGSMWKIPGMEKQMYMYRAAAYFARTFCPEVLNGMYTVEEIRDINGSEEPKKSQKTVINFD